MAPAVSPLAPSNFPDMPEIAGVRLATGAAGIRYKGRTDVLVVLFDNRTTLGLVRLKMKVAVDELTKLFELVFARGQAGAPAQPNILAGADDEIDRLFQ